MTKFRSFTRSLAIAGAAAGFVALSAPAQAESDFEFSANVAITNDYVFRGFTQTNEDFAIQGGFDVSHSSGFYIGTWASNVEFLDEVNGNSTSFEIDFYGGFAGDFANSIFSYDIAVIYYAYPGDPAGSDYAYWEFGLSLGADAGFAAFSTGIWYSPDFFGGTGDAIHIPLGIEVPIPIGDGLVAVAFSGELGYNVLLDDGQSWDGLSDDYLNWNLGLTIAIDGWFDVDLRYHDTDLDGTFCDKVCDARFVGTVSRSF